jgi:hypothetical protein
MKSTVSSVSIVTRLWAGRPGSILGRGTVISSSPLLCSDRMSSPLSFLTNKYQVLCQGIKRPVREADDSTSSSAEVKNAWSYTSTSPSDSTTGELFS